MMKSLLLLIAFVCLAVQAWAQRELLAADRTYYIDPSGSDVSGDGSAGNPWASPQFAIDLVSATLDTGRFTLTLQLGDGAYSGGVILRHVPGDLCPILSGNALNWNAVTLSNASGYAVLIGNDRQANRLPAPATWTLRHVRVTASGAGNRCVVATGSGTRINIDSVNFGACAAEHIVAEFGADVSLTGPYTIDGGATRHLQAFTGGRISWFFGSLTLAGSPAFVVFARVAHGGVIVTNGAGSITGTATGVRWQAVLNGVIDTQGGGGSVFPGSVGGSTASGGQFN